MPAFLVEVLIGLGAGYLFGIFPTGYLLGRLHGVDVRKYGSGRTGGTNVLRTLGWKAFIITIIGDALRGILPVLLVTRVIAPSSTTAAAAALLGALLGSNWSLVLAWLAHDIPSPKLPTNPVQTIRDFFARAKAGAGVVTAAGAAITLYWPVVIPLVIIGITVLVIFRYSSLASVIVAALYPVLMAYFVVIGQAPRAYLVMSVLAAAIVLYVLSPNMKRLLAGTERKFGQRVSVK